MSLPAPGVSGTRWSPFYDSPGSGGPSGRSRQAGDRVPPAEGRDDAHREDDAASKRRPSAANDPTGTAGSQLDAFA